MRTVQSLSFTLSTQMGNSMSPDAKTRKKIIDCKIQARLAQIDIAQMQIQLDRKEKLHTNKIKQCIRNHDSKSATSNAVGLVNVRDMRHVVENFKVKVDKIETDVDWQSAKSKVEKLLDGFNSLGRDVASLGKLVKQQERCTELEQTNKALRLSNNMIADGLGEVGAQPADDAVKSILEQLNSDVEREQLAEMPNLPPNKNDKKTISRSDEEELQARYSALCH